MKKEKRSFLSAIVLAILKLFKVSNWRSARFIEKD